MPRQSARPKRPKPLGRSGGLNQKAKSFTVEVHIQSDYFDDTPTHAVVAITPALAKQIRLMRDAVKECNGYCMEKFDSTPDFMKPIDPDEEPEEGLFPLLEEWDGRTECTVLHVDDRRFSWHSIIKHTSVTMETEGIDIKEIRWL